MSNISVVQPADRLLLIGDRDNQVANVLGRALPHISIVQAISVFDGIHQLHASRFGSVVLSSEPIERRPEAAVRVLRQLIGTGKLIAFGQPSLEPLNRRLIDVGLDDYFVTPADEHEVRQVFLDAASSRAINEQDTDEAKTSDSSHNSRSTSGRQSGQSPGAFIGLAHAPLAELIVEMLVQHPSGALDAIVRRMNTRLAPGQSLHWLPTSRDGAPVASQTPSPAPSLNPAVQLPVRNVDTLFGHLRMELPHGADADIARHMIAQLAGIFAKISVVEERNVHMQKLATTDELTGLNNGRFFKHKLRRVIEVARERRSPVTLLLFDIDNFKRYNDTFGHGVGDEILKQTAALMKRACRKHDVVARIAGDEFAVVFWEKEGPRQAKNPQSTGSSRVPQTPLIIAQRFRRLLASSEFSALGPQGKGVLSISGGMAVYPFDGDTPEKLIEAADRALMFGAKRSGKNQIALVGDGGSIPDFESLAPNASGSDAADFDPDLPPWEEV